MKQMQRQFLLGFIKIHILYHASKEPVYGVWLMDELARHGYSLSPGTLYPVLHSLEEQGYLKSTREVVNGKMRRYYVLTKGGEKALTLARERVRELVDEIIFEKDVPPVTGPDKPGR
jgi:DNA-binding PadR family transcriptional regulator